MGHHLHREFRWWLLHITTCLYFWLRKINSFVRPYVRSLVGPFVRFVRSVPSSHLSRRRKPQAGGGPPKPPLGGSRPPRGGSGGGREPPPSVLFATTDPVRRRDGTNETTERKNERTDERTDGRTNGRTNGFSVASNTETALIMGVAIRNEMKPKLGRQLVRFERRTHGFAKLIQTTNHYKKFLLTFGGKSFESKRNETKTERSRNENETERSWVTMSWPKFGGGVWVAVWRPKFWPKSGSPCGGRNFGRKKFSLRTNVTFVN